MKTFIAFLLSTVCVFAADRALVDLDTGQVLRVRKETTPPNIAWKILIVDTNIPAFNPTTEKLVDTNIVTSTTITQAKIVKALTQQEIDDRAALIADNTDREAKRVLVKNAIPTLRQWALDAQSVNVNNGNNNAVTQQLVDRTGIFFDRFADLLEAQRVDK